MQSRDWTSSFAGLERLPRPIREELRSGGSVLSLTAGTRVFGPGKSPTHYLLLLDGSIRVTQTSEQGREIMLYRIHGGESCVLTTACLMGFADYLAEGFVETEGHAVALPRGLFDDLIARSAEFRSFVFTAFSARITELFHVIEEVAFARIDIRLAQRLVALGEGAGRVAMTHQQLAVELGSAREVISRQLKEFERRGWVEVTRGLVVLRDVGALESLGRAR